MAVIYGFKVNGTTYEYDYNHLANKPAEIPSCDSNDAGKVLAVGNGGELEWKTPSGVTIPSVANANYGDVLMVTGDTNHGLMGWGTILPPWSNDDDGKVLKVNSDGELAWLPVGST